MIITGSLENLARDGFVTATSAEIGFMLTKRLIFLKMTAAYPHLR